uniref:Uncharacterized protein n=1 Tax=Arundo donax TaxID=35708 RepID=A0A0A9FG68_ARUDO
MCCILIRDNSVDTPYAWRVILETLYTSCSLSVVS